MKPYYKEIEKIIEIKKIVNELDRNITYIPNNITNKKYLETIRKDALSFECYYNKLIEYADMKHKVFYPNNLVNEIYTLYNYIIGNISDKILSNCIKRINKEILKWRIQFDAFEYTIYYFQDLTQEDLIGIHNKVYEE